MHFIWDFYIKTIFLKEKLYKFKLNINLTYIIKANDDRDINQIKNLNLNQHDYDLKIF